MEYAPALDGIVKLPWNIRRTEDQNTRIVVPNAIHLHEEFGLYSTRTLRLRLVTRPSKGVDLVNEDDRRFLFPCEFEELLDESIK